MGQLLTHKANDLVKYLIPKKFRLLLQSEKVTYQLRGMGEVLVAGGGRERQAPAVSAEVRKNRIMGMRGCRGWAEERKGVKMFQVVGTACVQARR